MTRTLHEHYDAFPQPSPETVPISPRQLDRIDDNLHYGWSWHRYKYVYRPSDHPRILDAGCGTGLTALGLARLNPQASVVGIDASPQSLALARQRAEVSPGLNVVFRQHDLESPQPPPPGSFDFIVCRHVLHQVADPVRVLRHLAAALDPRGLLLLTFPARGIQHAARQVRRAVRALAAPGSSLVDQAEIARSLFQSLRPDHPIRSLERLATGSDLPGRDRLIAAYLEPHGRDWDLEDGLDLLEQAGLRFLYAAAVVPWQADRVFGPDVPRALRDRVAALDEAARATLIDSLDPSANLVEHKVYACLESFEPHVPRWPEDPDPAALDSLIPHRTGLFTRAAPEPGQTAPVYRTAGGQLGPIDPTWDAMLLLIDDQKSCATVDQHAASLLGRADSPSARRQRWLSLVNRGFVLLESPDPRQKVDCIHLGAVRDRLDCPCPRKWLRSCTLHTFCTLDTIPTDDPSRPAYDRALQERALAHVMACATCADYQPEPEIVTKGS